MTNIKMIVGAMHAHAADCKKPFGECFICNSNMEAMGRIPAPLLSEVLQDVMRPPLRVSILDRMAEKVFANATVSRHTQRFLTSVGAKFDKNGRLHLPSR